MASSSEFLPTLSVCPSGMDCEVIGSTVPCEELPLHAQPLTVAEKLCPNVLIRGINRLQNDSSPGGQLELAWQYIELGLASGDEEAAQIRFRQAHDTAQLVADNSDPHANYALRAGYMQSCLPVFQARLTESTPSQATLQLAYGAVGKTIARLQRDRSSFGNVPRHVMHLVGELGVSGLLDRYALHRNQPSALVYPVAARERRSETYGQFAHNCYQLDERVKIPLNANYRHGSNRHLDPIVRALFFGRICSTFSEQFYRAKRLPSNDSIAFRLLQALQYESEGRAIEDHPELLDFTMQVAVAQLHAKPKNDLAKP